MQSLDQVKQIRNLQKLIQNNQLKMVKFQEIQLHLLKQIHPTLLNSLQILYLHFSHIKNITPIQSLNVPSLLQLSLIGNHIENIEILAKTTMPNLQILHLRFNCITDIGSIVKFQYPHLKTLWLDMNKIQDIEPLTKMNFPKLSKLTFWNNQIVNISCLIRLNLQQLKLLLFHIDEERCNPIINKSCDKYLSTIKLVIAKEAVINQNEDDDE